MFGRVVPNKNGLEEWEIDLYQSYYCGLCGALKKEFGRAGQLSLNYDTTFLVLLLTSLYEPENVEKRFRCLAHPMKRHYANENEFTHYAAAINILLAYYKCQDDWEDERKPAGYAYAKILAEKKLKAEEAYPRQAEGIKKGLAGLHQLEQSAKAKKEQEVLPEGENADPGSSWLTADLCANCFGELLGEIFVCKEDEWADVLRKLGKGLGRFIYLLDAWEDLERDVKKGLFNPLFFAKGSQDFESRLEEVLQMSMGDCTRAFEYLPIVANVSLLRNILYSGVWLSKKLAGIMEE
ncbi:MAG: hypothetical protein IJU50_07425 [Lachnospiraceae bacterium]|nr:hypothetical protein [Lachnospiraceae bacterium]